MLPPPPPPPPPPVVAAKRVETPAGGCRTAPRQHGELGAQSVWKQANTTTTALQGGIAARLVRDNGATVKTRIPKRLAL